MLEMATGEPIADVQVADLYRAQAMKPRAQARQVYFLLDDLITKRGDECAVSRLPTANSCEASSHELEKLTPVHTLYGGAPCLLLFLCQALVKTRPVDDKTLIFAFSDFFNLIPGFDLEA